MLILCWTHFLSCFKCNFLFVYIICFIFLIVILNGMMYYALIQAKNQGGILGRPKRSMKERSGNQLHGDHKPTHVDSVTNRIANVASRRGGEILGLGGREREGFRGVLVLEEKRGGGRRTR